MKLTIRTWPDVIAFYEGMAKEGDASVAVPMRAMADFVTAMAALPGSQGLYPYTTLATLGIVQTPEVSDGQDRILVRGRNDGQVEAALTDRFGWLGAAPPPFRGAPGWYGCYPIATAAQDLVEALTEIGWLEA
ncbi:MAG TPA: hypothetical protein VLT17_08065 [Gemmatimonadales bacterium]|jgi:hypothetical protein|nr:hypothetical protein [Gemmatimonadales bacterium]